MQIALRQFLQSWYVVIVLAAWAFVPELRRVVDWEIGFSSLPVIGLIPLVLLLPGMFLLKGEWPSLGPVYRTTLVIWLLGFGFAYLVAYGSHQELAGLYDGAQFVLPAGLGMLIAAQRAPDIKVAYERTANALLWIAAISAVYGIYQYVAPPPWDIFWVQNSKLASIGHAQPFGLRIFGPLNAPGPFGDFLALAILANLPRLRLGRIVTTLLLAPCIIALVLTEVRTSWIGVVIGIFVYLVLSPQRMRPLLALVTVTASCLALGAILINTVVGAENAVVTIQDRFDTFRELSDDTSVIARQSETSDAIASGLREPLGQGLGSVGTAAKLGVTETTYVLDNGYLSRFTEMGVLGSAAYLLALGFALFAALATYTRFLRRGDVAGASFAAFAVAIQVVLLWFDGASDHHAGFSGLFFWYSVFIVASLAATIAPQEKAGPVSLTVAFAGRHRE